LHARAGKEATGDFGILADFLLQNRTVNDAGWQFVLNDASDGAGFTADALSQVNDHNPSALLQRLFQRPLQIPHHADKWVFIGLWWWEFWEFRGLLRWLLFCGCLCGFA
jgi:hypothetical protein